MVKEIELLQKQIDRLSDENFDLQGWKSSTAILLTRIFGKDHEGSVRYQRN